MEDNKESYYYEFGIESGEDDEEEAEPSRAVIDLREICMFEELKDVDGPYGKVFPSITHLELKNGNQFGVFYPYSDFKVLYQRVMKMKIIRMPYPD